MYPQEFNAMNLPSIVSWASDKMEHYHSAPDSELPAEIDHWSFSDFFKKAPKSFYEGFTNNEGTEYHAVVTVRSNKYRGEKSFVTIALSRYIPA